MDDPQLYGIVRTVDDIAYGGLGRFSYTTDTASSYARPAILKGVC